VIEQWERKDYVQDGLALRAAFRNFCGVVEKHVEDMKGWDCLALHCAGVVRLDNNRNSFAQSTHARACLAHGAYIDDQGFIVYP
jgi:hypothetical protein